MTSRDDEARAHGPENAEHEIKKAYNHVIETGVTHFWDRKAIPGVNAYEVVTFYKRAMDAYRGGDRLAAERWARTAKHLARAYWHEAKISYFEPRLRELPFLDNASEEYNPRHQSLEDASQLLDSAGGNIPTPALAGTSGIPTEMRSYLIRGRRHLSILQEAGQENEDENGNELLRTERILAAHEYGRVVECLALAYEAENRKRGAA